ncbi:hypothetical protein [Pseudomonas folii]|uniref:Uncharacterized protein n=1 Tax=Pseudomonas folii TaxID=2762593 RepID=A0ABR7AWG4_9PSED|nr:hypothetical protein [Pseudomonas folii]MBC3949261.1 hypothetical protein [Pseudomonas folii]
MTEINSDSIRDLVNSTTYNTIVDALKKELGISVFDDDKDILCSFDTRSVNRSGLELATLEKLISENSKELILYSINKHRAMNGIQENQEYSHGEEPEEVEKDSNIVSKGYAPGFVLANAIEYLLDETGQKELEAYLKASRIPGAKKYAKKIATFKIQNQ